MKICVTAVEDTGLESEVATKFGRADYFVVVEGQEAEIIANQARNVASGAGVKAAQAVADKEVEVLITGDIGPKAFTGLDKAEIEVYSVDGGTVDEAVKAYQAGELEQLEGATNEAHAGLK